MNEGSKGEGVLWCEQGSALMKEALLAQGSALAAGVFTLIYSAQPSTRDTSLKRLWRWLVPGKQRLPLYTRNVSNSCGPVFYRPFLPFICTT